MKEPSIGVVITGAPNNDSKTHLTMFLRFKFSRSFTWSNHRGFSPIE